MKHYTVIAIDDEQQVLEDTAAVLRPFPDVELVGTFTSVPEATAYLRNSGNVDAVICDIRMPGISGLEAVSLLVNHCRLFVLLTGHPEHTIEAYNRGADMYLLKPLESTDVERLVGKLHQRTDPHPVHLRFAFDKVFAYSGEDKLYHPIPIMQITKMISKENYVYVFAPDLVTVVNTSLMKTVALMGPTGLFIQVSRTTLLAKHHITQVGNHIAYLGRETFQVDNQFRPAFRAFVRDHQFGRGNAFS